MILRKLVIVIINHTDLKLKKHVNVKIQSFQHKFKDTLFRKSNQKFFNFSHILKLKHNKSRWVKKKTHFRQQQIKKKNILVFTALFEAGGQKVHPRGGATEKRIVQSRGRVALHDGCVVEAVAAEVGRHRGRPRLPATPRGRPAEIGGGGRELPRRFGETTSVVGGNGAGLGGGIGGGVAGRR